MDPRLNGVTQADWDAIRTTNANVLAIGPESAVSGFLEALLPHLDAPVEIHEGGTFRPPNRDLGVLVLRNVGGFDGSAQKRLLDWLGEGRPLPTRTIATNTTSLFSSVERGAFINSLYYRLNVVTVAIGEQP